MESKDARKYAGWYKSYMDSNQGVALIECLEAKISQLEQVIETIKGETELVGEQHPAMTIKSIEAIIDQIGPIEASRGYFKWEILP